jgi:hypothetical protein
VRPRDVGAGLAGVEATEGLLIVRLALEAIEFAAKVVTLPPKLIALAKRHNQLPLVVVTLRQSGPQSCFNPLKLVPQSEPKSGRGRCSARKA